MPENVAVTQSTPEASKKRGPRKKDSESEQIIYALAKEEPGKNGLPQLIEAIPSKGAVMMAAIRQTGFYYTLQRHKVVHDDSKGKVTLSSEPVPFLTEQ